MMVHIREMVEECPVQVSLGKVILDGSLCVPKKSQAIVLFAHGSGSSRLSPRNQFVARELRNAGLGTLLFDLLTRAEEETDIDTAQYRFNIPLLANRLVGATDWLMDLTGPERFKIGYFGASTGAAAAIIAAAKRPKAVGAIVSRGGRPDLAEDALTEVEAPTLLIVGGNDVPVMTMNQDALRRLKAEKKLEIVPGATHLFEEAGTLEKVARLAIDWFNNYLNPQRKN
jgi:putative phosphoribosyl transferase